MERAECLIQETLIALHLWWLRPFDMLGGINCWYSLGESNPSFQVENLAS